MGLKVKLLSGWATVPTVAHPGEDLAYDLYASESAVLVPGRVAKISTGISVEATDPYGKPVGLLVKDRSSVASKGLFTHGGVIDAGYRGEVSVLMSMVDSDYAPASRLIKTGDKIAQMIPTPVLTGPVEVVDELSSSSRGEKGFGSSGK
jgi:dUTP pyrophosphatase